MKINFLIILVISVVLCFSGCKLGSSDKVDEENKVEENKELTYGGCDILSTKGKVVKIDEYNTVVIEVDVNRGGYKVGDRIRVRYDRYMESLIDSPTAGKKESIPEIGDIISIQYWPEDIYSGGEMDLVIVWDASRYVEEYTDRMSKEDAVQMRVIEGIIEEIEDNNTILLKIWKEMGGYRAGDKVKVKYETYFQEDLNSYATTNNSIIPQVGDLVGVQFMESEQNEIEENLIVVEEVCKYIEEVHEYVE